MEAFSLAELVLVAHCSDLISSDKKTDNDEISSQISAQIFEFCDNELFPETTTLQNSDEVSSCSNYCYDHDTSSFHHQPRIAASASSEPASATSATAAAMSSIFDPQDDIIDHDISASIDFSSPTSAAATSVVIGPSPPPPPPPPPPQLLLGGPADFAVLPNISLGVDPTAAAAAAFAMQPYDDVGPGYPLPMNPSSPSCAYHHLGPASLAPYLGPLAATDASGLFPASLLMPSDFQAQDLDFQPDFCSDSMQRVFNPGELQALGSESQQLIGGGGSSGSLGSDMSNMGDQTFKVGKLSVEQRKEKIHRYMKKRNERNFSKKIKYACRKTLADSRPRVRGRFAKNDDFGDTPRAASSNHEDDDEEEVVVKEEDDMVDSSDIFAHISGVNSFKCNYPIQSWI